MGDRALVIFANKTDVSPTTYLHWGGSGTPYLLHNLAIQLTDIEKHMAGRKDDVIYTCARFLGVCHSEDPKSNLSLGVWNTPPDIVNTIHDRFNALPEDKESLFKKLEELLSEYSHGDAGVVLVTLPEFSCEAFGGYLENSNELRETGYDA